MEFLLKELKEATNKALEEAQKRKSLFIMEAINWGDLSCHITEYCIDDDGRRSYRAWIEEASPSCPVFCKYISDRLEAAGFFEIEVITEW